jgi:arylsulfatase A-like enzyme
MRPICFLLFTFILSIAAGQSNEKPNILWISAEDICPHLGCYGDLYAITPNIDALAKEGVRYTHAYTTAGVCAPCRSGIITGMYQNSIGTQHMRCNATLPQWLKPFPQYLREAGYYCTNNSKTDYQFSSPGPKEIWDDSSAKAHWKNRKPGQPFFAVYNYTGCHESGIADAAKYKKVTKDLTPKQRQDPGAFQNLPPYYPDTSIVREDWKRNYEVITAMDAWAGDLINELKEAGEWENTVVMFWSDHGAGLPRAKRWLYESGTHIPLVVRFPESLQALATQGPGEVEARLVSSIDFGPTMLQVAGLDTPGTMQGVSFLRKDGERSHIFGARDRMDERYDIIRMVRDQQYRYIRNFEPLKPYYQYINTAEQGATMKEIRAAEKSGALTPEMHLFSADRKPVEELYDAEADPHEVNNLADDPAYGEVLGELRMAMTEWQLQIGDLGLMPESEILRREKNAGSAFDILHGETDQSALVETLTAVATAASTGVGAFPDLLGALGHDDAAVRYWGATGLGNFADEAKEEAGAMAALDERLDDESPAVVIAAARALCRMGLTTKGLAALETQLTGDNEWARLEAVIVLDELEETARPALASMQAALLDQPNKYIVRVANKAVNDLLGTANQVP